MHAEYATSPTANCPGSYANAIANPGYLCVYQLGYGGILNFKFSQVFDLENLAETQLTSKFGALVNFETEGPGFGSVLGSWAVTAAE